MTDKQTTVSRLELEIDQAEHTILHKISSRFHTRVGRGSLGDERPQPITAIIAADEIETGRSVMAKLADATDASLRSLRNSEASVSASLDQALAVFGYSDAAPSHHRYTLLSAIALFAVSNGRREIGAACEAMMGAIREKNANG